MKSAFNVAILLVAIFFNTANADMLANAAASLGFKCEECGAFHGGLYDNLCPECYNQKLFELLEKDPKNQGTICELEKFAGAPLTHCN